MKREFQVGDRVRVYTNDLSPDWTVRDVEITEIHGDFVAYKLKGTTYYAHKKNCRRLHPRKKAEKPERVERWFYPACEKYFEVYTANPQSKGQRCHHLVELFEGEIPLDRKRLAEAYQEAFGGNDFGEIEERDGFKVMAKALGLPEEK